MAKELTKAEKLKALMRQVNKDYKGQSPLQFASDTEDKGKISTGIPEIDKQIGGGWQRGNVSVVFGGPGAGKSSICLHSVADAQKNGLICMYIDLEGKFDKARAKSLGVSLEELVFVSSKEVRYAEQAMDIIRRVASEGLIDLIVLDSIQGMAPKGELETKQGKIKSTEDDTMALLARKLSQFFRGVVNPLSQGKAALLMIGQLRMNLGSFIVTGKLSGGNALEHFAVLILQVRHGPKANAPVITRKEFYIDEETEKERYRTVKEPCGHECVCKLNKCHVSGGSREGSEFSLPFYNDTGFVIPQPETDDDSENTSNEDAQEVEDDEVIEGDDSVKEEQEESLGETKKKTRGRKSKVK